MCSACSPFNTAAFSMGQRSKPSQFSDRGGDLVVGDLHIYRQWSFGMLGPRLAGMSVPIPWPAGELRADCWKSDLNICEEAPGAGCNCGIWGYYRPDEDWSNGGIFAAVFGGPTVWGVAKVGGRCLLGGRGLRAARATPVAIVTGDQQEQEALNRFYPDVRVFSQREQLLEAHPPSDWESLIGPIDPSPHERWQREQAERARQMHAAMTSVTERMKLTSQSFSDFQREYLGSAAMDVTADPEAKETKPQAARPKGPTPPQKAYGPAAGRLPFRRRGRG